MKYSTSLLTVNGNSRNEILNYIEALIAGNYRVTCNGKLSFRAVIRPDVDLFNVLIKAKAFLSHPTLSAADDMYFTTNLTSDGFTITQDHMPVLTNDDIVHRLNKPRAHSVASMGEGEVDIKTFLTANYNVLNEYFSQQRTLIRTCIANSGANHIKIRNALLVSNQRVMKAFLKSQVFGGEANPLDVNTQGQQNALFEASIPAEHSSNTVTQSAAAARSKRVNKPLTEVVSMITPGKTPFNTAQEDSADEHLERTLIDAVASVSGFDRNRILLDSDLESDFGIDSISLIKVLQRVGKTQPDLKIVVRDFREAKTLRQILHKIQNMRKGRKHDWLATDTGSQFWQESIQ